MFNFKKLIKKSKEGNIHALYNLFQGCTMPFKKTKFITYKSLIIKYFILPLYLYLYIDYLFWYDIYYFNEWINLCKTNEEHNKEIFKGESNNFFSPFFTLLNTWEMKSIAETNCEIHKLVEK